MFYLALPEKNSVQLTVLYADTHFFFLSSIEPYLYQYRLLYLVAISGILVRILKIVFTSGLRLVVKPYLTRI